MSRKRDSRKVQGSLVPDFTLPVFYKKYTFSTDCVHSNKPSLWTKNAVTKTQLGSTTGGDLTSIFPYILRLKTNLFTNSSEKRSRFVFSPSPISWKMCTDTNSSLYFTFPYFNEVHSFCVGSFGICRNTVLNTSLDIFKIVSRQLHKNTCKNNQ